MEDDKKIFKKKTGIDIIETSAKISFNIKEAFKIISRKLIEKFGQSQNKLKITKDLIYEKNQDKKENFIYKNQNKEEKISSYLNLKEKLNNEEDKTINIEIIKERYKEAFNKEVKKMKKTLIKAMGHNLKNIKNKYKEIYQLKEKELDQKLDEINKLNININNIEIINNLKEENINLQNEIIKLKKIISRFPLDLSENDNILILLIMTKDEKIIFPLLCKNSDNIKKIETIFYKEYPEYQENKGNFFINNNLMDKDKTLEEYKLKNNDIIIFEEFKTKKEI